MSSLHLLTISIKSLAMKSSWIWVRCKTKVNWKLSCTWKNSLCTLLWYGIYRKTSKIISIKILSSLKYTRTTIAPLTQQVSKSDRPFAISTFSTFVSIQSTSSFHHSIWKLIPKTSSFPSFSTIPHCSTSVTSREANRRAVPPQPAPTSWTFSRPSHRWSSTTWLRPRSSLRWETMSFCDARRSLWVECTLSSRHASCSLRIWCLTWQADRILHRYQGSTMTRWESKGGRNTNRLVLAATRSDRSLLRSYLSG